MIYIWWIIFGLIAGGIAKLIMPGKDPGGLFVTMLIGIGGAMLGGFVGQRLGFESAGSSGLGFGLIWAILGALLILFIWKKLVGPRL